MKPPKLKTGMIIELRDGSRSIIIGDIHVAPSEWPKRTWGNLDWDKDLKYKSHLKESKYSKSSDIMKVWANPRSNMEYFDIEARELIFNREESFKIEG